MVGSPTSTGRYDDIIAFIRYLKENISKSPTIWKISEYHRYRFKNRPFALKLNFPLKKMKVSKAHVEPAGLTEYFTVPTAYGAF